MSWQAYMVAYLFLGFVVARFFQKKAADCENPQKLLVWQFVTAALLAVVYYSLSAGSSGNWWHPSMPWVVAVGVLNGAANHFHWKALRISLSKTSVLTQFDDITAIGLSLVFLGEYRLLRSPSVLMGVSLCFLSAWLFVRAHNETVGIQNKSLLVNVLGFSFMWGTVGYAFRALALTDLPPENFLVVWYPTSLLTLAVIGLWSGNLPDLRSPVKHTAWAVGAGAAIFVSLHLMYRVRQLTFVTVTQPIVLVGEMTIPFAIGWYVFREGKAFSRMEKAAVLVGFAGGIILAFA